MLPRHLVPNQGLQLLTGLAKSLHATCAAIPPRIRPRRPNHRIAVPRPRLDWGLGDAPGKRCNLKRSFHIQSFLLPPVIFGGLLVGLYAWKSVMLVLFQNKILYNPGLPPSARFERIEDYEKRCGGLRWLKAETQAEDRTRLALVRTTVQLAKGDRSSRASQERANPAHIYVLYLQGNASSTPPRLPDLSWVLRAVSESKAHQLPPLDLTFVCLSYRGYWTSSGRPSEKGIQRDTIAAAQWIEAYHESKYGDAPDPEKPAAMLFLWGQSIGCGIATNLAASTKLPQNLPVRGIVLETPFLSVRAMLEELYPQKWLPYKYLWPFVRNHLDSWTNFGTIAESAKGSDITPQIFILEAARDELVPAEHGERLFQRCVDLGLLVERRKAEYAYHNEAIARGGGKKAVAEAIIRMTERALIQDAGQNGSSDTENKNTAGSQD